MMNKNDLVTAIAEKTGFTKKSVTEVHDALFAVIEHSLSIGEEVRITGFGTFSVAERAAREGRNPQTGETIRIEARRSPKFKPGKKLKEVVA